MNVRELDINKIKLEKLDIPDDVDLAGDLLSREHYLGNCKLQGEQMRYVATYRGKWVAILYFHHATRHSADRDKLIGWDLGLRVKRRKYISGNARYLVLKEFTGIRNLGSKILSLVAESFLKPSGTCSAITSHSVKPIPLCTAANYTGVRYGQERKKPLLVILSRH